MIEHTSAYMFFNFWKGGWEGGILCGVEVKSEQMNLEYLRKESDSAVHTLVRSSFHH